jgi:aspartyl-tRNA synthetase
MTNYGVDKPDLRFENRIQDVSSCFLSAPLPFLQDFTGRKSVIVIVTVLKFRPGPYSGHKNVFLLLI